MVRTISGPYQRQVVRVVEGERKLILCSDGVFGLTSTGNKLYDYSDNYLIHLNPC